MGDKKNKKISLALMLKCFEMPAVVIHGFKKHQKSQRISDHLLSSGIAVKSDTSIVVTLEEKVHDSAVT